MRNKRNTQPDADAAPASIAHSERLRTDLERLGLAPARIESVAKRLEPMLASLSPEQYGAVLAGVAAGQASRASTEFYAESGFDLADVERLMDGVREEVQKLGEGLRMLSAYVTGLRKRSERRPGDTVH